jgi:hypothetical protein
MLKSSIANTCETFFTVTNVVNVYLYIDTSNDNVQVRLQRHKWDLVVISGFKKLSKDNLEWKPWDRTVRVQVRFQCYNKWEFSVTSKSSVLQVRIQC